MGETVVAVGNHFIFIGFAESHNKLAGRCRWKTENESHPVLLTVQTLTQTLI